MGQARGEKQHIARFRMEEVRSLIHPSLAFHGQVQHPGIEAIGAIGGRMRLRRIVAEAGDQGCAEPVFGGFHIAE